jgi:hypothetical protein
VFKTVSSGAVRRPEFETTWLADDEGCWAWAGSEPTDRKTVQQIKAAPEKKARFRPGALRVFLCGKLSIRMLKLSLGRTMIGTASRGCLNGVTESPSPADSWFWSMYRDLLLRDLLFFL